MDDSDVEAIDSVVRHERSGCSSDRCPDSSASLPHRRQVPDWTRTSPPLRLSPSPWFTMIGLAGAAPSVQWSWCLALVLSQTDKAVAIVDLPESTLHSGTSYSGACAAVVVLGVSPSAD